MGFHPIPHQTFLKKSLDQKTFKVLILFLEPFFGKKGSKPPKKLYGFSFPSFPKEDVLRLTPLFPRRGVFFYPRRREHLVSPKVLAPFVRGLPQPPSA
ncbi:MAG: hypothetical protein IKC69_02525, partial [Clostridia bacterium]|nr:hypothetical protein [Clostridia bacterium]